MVYKYGNFLSRDNELYQTLKENWMEKVEKPVQRELKLA